MTLQFRQLISLDVTGGKVLLCGARRVVSALVSIPSGLLLAGRPVSVRLDYAVRLLCLDSMVVVRMLMTEQCVYMFVLVDLNRKAPGCLLYRRRHRLMGARLLVSRCAYMSTMCWLRLDVVVLNVVWLGATVKLSTVFFYLVGVVC